MLSLVPVVPVSGRDPSAAFCRGFGVRPAELGAARSAVPGRRRGRWRQQTGSGVKRAIGGLTLACSGSNWLELADLGRGAPASKMREISIRPSSYVMLGLTGHRRPFVPAKGPAMRPDVTAATVSAARIVRPRKAARFVRTGLSGRSGQICPPASPSLDASRERVGVEVVTMNGRAKLVAPAPSPAL